MASASCSASAGEFINQVCGVAIPSDAASEVVCCLSKAFRTVECEGITSFPPAEKIRSRCSDKGSMLSSVMGRIRVGGCFWISVAMCFTNASGSSSGEGWVKLPFAYRDHPALDQENVEPTTTECPARASERTHATAWFSFPSSTKIFIRSPHQHARNLLNAHLAAELFRQAPQRIVLQLKTNQSALPARQLPAHNVFSVPARVRGR